jgi:alginate O-acetyltransferase complex protein AlgI
MLLGFNLPQNFDFPYFSTSIADFWRRWHITLGDWLRNYLYFPLGGSRRGLIRTCLNLLIVMLVAGLWHGAAWGFVVWGAAHGLALIVHRLTEACSRRWQFLQAWWNSLPGILFAWLLTQVMVFTAWISFRLPNLQDSLLVLQRLWGHTADVQFAQKVYVEALQLDRLQLSTLLGLLGMGMGLSYLLHRVKLKLNWPIKILLVPLCLFAAWLLAPNQSQPYIYFDF